MRRLIFIAACLILNLHGLAVAQDAETLHRDADAAVRKGEYDAAIKLMTRAIELNEKDHRAYATRGMVHSLKRDWAAAEADFAVVIKARPDEPSILASRAGALLAQGKIKESLADFDKVIELRPDSMPHFWQRGIALYYAGRYEEGQKQFEAHQTVNPNDVENAAWHYVCVARAKGITEARKRLIPTQDDARIPMAEVQQLYAGKMTPPQVLAVAEAVNDPKRKDHALFYAHLYIGLFHEAAGDAEAARAHMTKAAEMKNIDNYMHDLARVHVKLMEQKPPKGSNGAK